MSSRIRRAQERHDDSHPTVAPGVDGLLPASSNLGHFLRDDGTWAEVVGGGGLLSPTQRAFVRARPGASMAPVRGPINATSTGLARTSTVRSVSCLPIEQQPRWVKGTDAGTRSASLHDPTTRAISTTHGFAVRIVFGVEVWDAASRLFAGLTRSTTAPDLTADATAATTHGMIGVCMDSSGTHWQWVHAATTSPSSASTGVAYSTGEVCVLTLTSSNTSIDMTFRQGTTEATTTVTANYPDSITLGTDADPCAMLWKVAAYHTAGSGGTDVALVQVEYISGVGAGA